MDVLYRIRDWVGLPPALLVLLLLIAIPSRHLVSRLSGGQFELSIEAPAPLPSPSPPELVPPTESPPVQAPSRRATSSPRVRDSARLAAKAPPEPARAPLLPAVPNEPLAPDGPSVPSVPSVPAKPSRVAPAMSSPAPQEAKNLGIEEAYIAQVRSNVQSRKRYPTGREASTQRPSGTVRACMDLSRDGIPASDVIIERTSHSMILDAEARKLLRMGAYPPFPPGAFQGRSTQRFCIHLDYAFQPTG